MSFISSSPASGTDGKTILSGVVDPTTEGTDGDFYLNTATSYLFGPKAAGVWPAGIPLIGAPGTSIINLDGGNPTSIYGGTFVVDSGGP